MKRIFALCAVLFAASCNEGEPGPEGESRPVCSVDNPAVDLPWLAEIVDEAQSSIYWADFIYVQQAYYLNEPVFIVGNCCPNCSYVVPVYNCEGELICYLNDCLEGFVTYKKVIWKSEQSNCFSS